MDIRVRAYATTDRAPVMALAPRLGEGVAPWRDPDAVRAAVTRWVETALAEAGEPAKTVLVAEVANQAARAFYQRLGFHEEDVRLTLAVNRPD